MMSNSLRFGLGLALCIGGGVALAVDRPAPKPQHKVKESKNGNLVAVLCDGETSVELNAKPGENVSTDEARRAADTLMAEWRRKNPDAKWDEPTLLAQNDTKGVNERSGAGEAKEQQKASIQSGQTYGNFSERDQKVWAASTEAFIKQGDAIFHDAKKLGGTTAMSCDMCHPNAANTHPETYPKYQVQLGRVALLRDMINWCIENPVRGKPLPDGDPSLRALEAYIYAQRKGVALEYGKH